GWSEGKVEDERVLLRRVEVGRIGDDAVEVEAVVLPGEHLRAAELPLGDEVVEVRELPRLGVERGEDVELARVRGRGGGEGDDAVARHGGVGPVGVRRIELAEVEAARV